VRRWTAGLAGRGTALRAVAQVQTKKSDTAPARLWAARLPDPEDRAYSLLGVAEALLDINPATLPCDAIQIH
jgi:hypothetical protein